MLSMNSLKLHNEDFTLDDCDGDLCDKSEVQNIFQKCSFVTEATVSKPENYILHVTGTRNASPNVALGLSNNEVKVFAFADCNMAEIATFSEHKDSVIDVKFSSENYNLLYTGSSDGTIKLWDTRLSESVSTMTDTSQEEGKGGKVLNCFDLSPNEKLLAAGTDLFLTDAFVLFWDVRNLKLLGGYWESHTDDITQVKFHPNDSNKLTSGSTDGLINVYDLSQTCEDDALTETYNTESSVERLTWSETGNQDLISCVTHTADLQLWKFDDVQPKVAFTRKEISEKMMRKSSSHCYVVGTHENLKNELFVLAGSISSGDQCLRGLYVQDSLKPAFYCPNNRQIIRSSWYNISSNLLLTGGEEGILSAWNLTFDSNRNGLK